MSLAHWAAWNHMSRSNSLASCTVEEDIRKVSRCRRCRANLHHTTSRLDNSLATSLSYNITATYFPHTSILIPFSLFQRLCWNIGRDLSVLHIHRVHIQVSTLAIHRGLPAASSCVILLTDCVFAVVSNQNIILSLHKSLISATKMF